MTPPSAAPSPPDAHEGTGSLTREGRKSGCYSIPRCSSERMPTHHRHHSDHTKPPSDLHNDGASHTAYHTGLLPPFPQRCGALWALSFSEGLKAQRPTELPHPGPLTWTFRPGHFHCFPSIVSVPTWHPKPLPSHMLRPPQLQVLQRSPLRRNAICPPKVAGGGRPARAIYYMGAGSDLSRAIGSPAQPRFCRHRASTMRRRCACASASLRLDAAVSGGLSMPPAVVLTGRMDPETQQNKTEPL